jgi:hypothetical protein
MARPLVKFHNAVSGEIIEREMNDDEFAQWEIDLAWAAERKAQHLAKENAKAELLERLGITADEAASLLS